MQTPKVSEQIMSSHPSESRERQEISAKLKPAFVALLEAFDYAKDTGSEVWDFAVPMHDLKQLGLNETSLRWLARKKFVRHAREVTVPGDDGRQFRSTGDLTFSSRTCFVLTEAGISKARSLVTETQAVSASEDGTPCAQIPVPHWDAQTRELRVHGQIVKRFKWQAVNQEIVLSAFQEDGWPAVIDDPLPPRPEQDTKRRLHDTIKSLNRNQEHVVIRFRGNGTGEGIRWEFIDDGKKGP